MKILIIKPSSFGDIIQANPVLPALLQNYPKARIYWLVFKAWEETLDLFPDIAGKIVWDKKAGIREYFRVISEVRKEKFDIVVDLQGLARTALIARMSGAHKVIGVPGMKEFSSILVKETFPQSAKINATKRNLETVRYLTGKTFDPVFNIKIPQASVNEARELLAKNGVQNKEEFIVFVPAARGAAKTWPAGYYYELAAKLQNKKIMVLGAEGDGKLLKNEKIIDLSGKTNIKVLAAILSLSKAVVGGDTGPLHLSAALGVPSVMIFGGSDVDETSPVSPVVKVISRRLPCSPCRGKPSCEDHQCLTGIKPEEVMSALDEILKS
jgi:lipopolysaccharide heptosyltransferase II